MLTLFLNENSIDLSADKVASLAAQAYLEEQHVKEKLAENLLEQRDSIWVFPFKHVKEEFQFLKKLYPSNPMRISEWGAPVLVGGKIKYPNNIIEQTAILTLLKAKHDSYAAGTSPLDPFLTANNIDLDNDDDLKDKVILKHNDSVEASMAAEEATENRYLIFDPVLDHIYMIGQFLMKLFPNNTKKLGEWGFTVDNSPQKPKSRTSTLKLGTTKTLNGLVIGSQLENIGTVEVELYRGSTSTGTPVIITPGGTFGIAAKHSIVTIKNTSLLETAKVKTMTYKS